MDLEVPDPLPDDLTVEERDYLARVERWDSTDGGYAHKQQGESGPSRVRW